jgi:hypothetical protein
LEAVEAMVAERRRAAESGRHRAIAAVDAGPSPREAAPPGVAVTLRLARPDDARALERLAQLDSRSPPSADHTLVAEVDGNLVAALPLDGGRPIADPFRATAELVRLLQLRADQLKGTGRRSARWFGANPLLRWRARARPRAVET